MQFLDRLLQTTTRISMSEVLGQSAASVKARKHEEETDRK